MKKYKKIIMHQPAYTQFVDKTLQNRNRQN